MSIFINVVNQKMYTSSSMENFISGSQEFVRFRFNLSEEWDNLLIFAQFIQNNVAYNQYLDEENSVCLPSEIGAGVCTLTLYGSNNGIIATTNHLTLSIDKNVLMSDAQSTEISTSLYNQLVTKVLVIEDKIEDIESNEGISYIGEQNLTDEQKEVARNNIDAVDANLVVSSLSGDEQIPNGAALKEYVSKHTEYSCVRYDVQQYLSEYDQEVARSNIGAVSQAELDEAVANAGGSGDFISYTETQDLTKEQKAQARENIGAFNADKVKSTLDDLDGLSDNVLTVSGTMELIEGRTLNPNLSNDYPIFYKYQMLKHLEGKWELLYTIEGDGETNNWEFTKFADGSDLKLRAAAVKTINTVAASADTYGYIYAYDSSFNVISTAVITKFLSKTAGAVALGIIEQDKGYYRAYAADGANKNPGNVRYSGFQQYNEIGNIETTPYIPRIRVNNQTTAYLPVGSTIEVWGVKA